jgi:hypothetical protein
MPPLSADPEAAPEPAPSPPAAPLDLAREVVTDFFEAAAARNVDRMLELSGLPFSFDRDLFDSEEALRREFEEAVEKINESPFSVVSATPVSDWRAFADHYAGPDTEVTAVVVLVRVEDKGDFDVVMFVRPGSPPLLVGIKD